MANEFFVSLAATRVRVELHPFAGTHKIIICRQCAKAPCKDACPEAAITLREDGAWIIDYERCNACLKCIDACPFEAIFLIRSLEELLNARCAMVIYNASKPARQEL